RYWTRPAIGGGATGGPAVPGWDQIDPSPCAYSIAGKSGSAAWKWQARDRFIGWTTEERSERLHLLTNDTRFLTLPWVRVPHLAGWALGSVLRRLSRDWHRKYGHTIVLVETFVERRRFAGTSCRAANWIRPR